jgi:NAD(P)-dependent dehydrogenase (short-subunit alcohol dehydrogenase family)
MKVFVAGASGVLGRTLVPQLVERGHEVVGMTRTASKQGVLQNLLITIVLAVLAAVLGSEYNVLERINLPSIPVDGASLGTGGIIATVAIVLGTLTAALLGGKVVQR